ncbi:MAG: right-handed parallel beta-helix repeat-containing protein, partial [bacterium]|nr:right-handed parallel beta-helix repeat-containing protein [bacterium]
MGIYPNFVGIPDLHINPAANTPVESNGQPIDRVAYDFDNQLRSATAPDIGADEGNFIGGGDFFRPRISHLPLGRTDDTGPRVAMAYITDNIGLATGTAAPKLYYRRSIDPTFTMVSADSVRQDSIFYFTIAGQPLTTIVEYYLAAQDTSGNLATMPGGGSGLNPPGSTPPATTFSYDLQMVISGTRTIGGTNPDFATISDAIAALNNQGTGSGVTFLIRGGTYTGVSDSITAGANGAPNRPIIFKPADTLGVVIEQTPLSAGAAFGFALVNTDNVIFDGSHPDAPGRNFITVNVLGTYGYYGFLFANGSDNCKIKNVNVSVQQTTSSSFRTIYTQYRSTGLPLVGCSFDTIENCFISNGYYGMYLYWTTGSTLNNWYVANNDVYDFYYYGIYHYYMQNSMFTGNRIHRSGPASSAMYAFYASTGTNNNSYIGNRIYDVGASGTATCYGFYSTSGTNQLIANNMINIDATGGGAVYGIYKSSNANGKLYYNTVRLGGSTGGSYNSYALYYSSASLTDSLANNIWINERTGGTATQYQIGMYVPNTNPFAFSDNNIYSTVNDDPTDNRHAIRVGTANYNTLDDARTGGWTTFDASSLGIPLAFVGAQDLHIN